MTAATVIPPGGGEVIGDAPDRRVEILCERDPLHATWSRFGPRRDGADLHVHRHHSDLFYVLDGELTVRLGPHGEEMAMPAGTLARLPPLVVHGFRNGSDAEVRYLNLHAPGSRFASYLRSLRDGSPIAYDQEDPPADGGRPTAEAVFGHETTLVDRPELRVAVLADEPDVAVAGLDGETRALAPLLDLADSVFVLDGELVLAAGRAGAGSWVDHPRASPQPGQGRARVLAIRAPGAGLADELRDALTRAPAPAPGP